MSRIRYTEGQLNKIIFWINTGQFPENMPSSTKYRWEKKLRDDFELREEKENGKTIYFLFYKKKRVVAPSERIDIMSNEYTFPTGWQPFFAKLREKYVNISEDDVRQYLNSLEIKQVMRPTQEQAVIKPIITNGPYVYT